MKTAGVFVAFLRFLLIIYAGTQRFRPHTFPQTPANKMPGAATRNSCRRGIFFIHRLGMYVYRLGIHVYKPWTYIPSL